MKIVFSPQYEKPFQYLKEIKPVLEQGVPIWDSGLTKGQLIAVENGFEIILCENYVCEVACTPLNLLLIQFRRADLAANFAIKLYKSSKSLEFFEPAQKQTNTRSENLIVKDKVRNTRRCFNAPQYGQYEQA